MSNVSYGLIGLQSQSVRDRDAGGLKVTKIKSKQSTLHVRFHFLEENWKYQMPVRTADLDKAIADVIGKFDGVEEISAGLREGIIFKGKTYWRSCWPTMENHRCSSYLA